LYKVAPRRSGVTQLKLLPDGVRSVVAVERTCRHVLLKNVFGAVMIFDDILITWLTSLTKVDLEALLQLRNPGPSSGARRSGEA
jgi:hypothetical protein